MNSDRLVKLHLHDPAKGPDAGWYESVWAEVTDDGHARLRNQPVVFPVLKRGEVVEIRRRWDGELYADARSNE